MSTKRFWIWRGLDILLLASCYGFLAILAVGPDIGPLPAELATAIDRIESWSKGIGFDLHAFSERCAHAHEWWLHAKVQMEPTR